MLSVTPVTTVEHPVTVNESAQEIVLENQFVRAVFQRGGLLVSFVDKRAGREMIAGDANRFVLFNDEPCCYDAWNIEIYHLEKRLEPSGAASACVVENDALRVSIEFLYELTPRSKLRQTVSLTAISPRLDFSCEAQWDEEGQIAESRIPHQYPLRPCDRRDTVRTLAPAHAFQQQL